MLTVVYLVVRISLLKRVGQDPTTLRSFFTSVSELGWLLMRYVGITLAPIGHSPDYGLKHPDPLWRVLGFLVTGGLLLFATRRARHGVRFGAWLFVLGLLPVLHLVPVWTLMADRFVLVPSVGIALVVAGLVVEAEARRATLVVGFSLVCFLAWGVGISQEASASRATTGYGRTPSRATPTRRSRSTTSASGSPSTTTPKKVSATCSSPRASVATCRSSTSTSRSRSIWCTSRRTRSVRSSSRSVRTRPT